MSFIFFVLQHWNLFYNKIQDIITIFVVIDILYRYFFLSLFYIICKLKTKPVGINFALICSFQFT